MTIKYKGLSNNDYTNAGILCEFIFLAFALISRIMGDNTVGFVGGLFAFAGLVLMGRGYKGAWPV
jgi:hypothetical protein